MVERTSGWFGSTLPPRCRSRGVLENRWANFPSYDALTDSIREDGGKLERGPVRVDVGPGGPVAYQAYFGLRPAGGMVLAWVTRRRTRSPRCRSDACGGVEQSCSGTPFRLPRARAQSGRLEEAKRWMELADSALR